MTGTLRAAAAPDLVTECWQVLPLAADSPAGLARLAREQARSLDRAPVLPLREVAERVDAGRTAGPCQQVVIARTAAHAAELLRDPDPGLVISGETSDAERTTVFIFPGVGDHHFGMAQEAYRQLPAFRPTLDRTAEILRARARAGHHDAAYPLGPRAAAPEGMAGADLGMLRGRGEAAGPLHRTRVAQPVVFAVEYRLARLLMSWGVAPTAMVGYSVGEYIAACLAGVIGLEDALGLVARRAMLIEEAPPGAMLVAQLGADELVEQLDRFDGDVSLAAINGPGQCVASGSPAAVARLAEELGARGVATLPVPTRHAFHSPMMAGEQQHRPAAQRVGEPARGQLQQQHDDALHRGRDAELAEGRSPV